MMYGGSDAAADLGPPSGWPQGPGDGVRVPGLERRRRRRLERRLVPRLGARAPRRFARIDSEEFYDFQANRPCIRFDENERREIVWPTVEIFEAPAPRAPRDLVLVQGVEPSMRWRAFSAHIVDLAEALGVQLVVTLGALLGDVPAHAPGGDDRPRLRPGADGAAGHRSPPRYEGPTGIVGVLHTRLRRRRAALGEPVGGASPTTSPRPPTRRRRSRCCARWKA